MKIFCLLCVFIFLQYSIATLELTSLVGFVPLCMTVTQLLKSIEIMCGNQRSNATLWDLMIKCHRPIDDTFLRKSDEATCPLPKEVTNTTDTNYSIEKVFFNICGLVNGTYLQRAWGLGCLAAGHVTEVLEVQKKWGRDVPCNIGKCVLRVFKDLGQKLGV